MVCESDEIFDTFVNLSKKDHDVRYFPASPKNRLYRNKKNEISGHRLLFDIVFDDDNTLEQDFEKMNFIFEKMKVFDRKLFTNVYINIYPGKNKFSSDTYEKLKCIVNNYYRGFMLSTENYVELMKKAKKVDISGLIVFANKSVLQQIEEKIEEFAISGIHCYTWETCHAQASPTGDFLPNSLDFAVSQH